MASLSHIKEMDHDSLLVKSADVLHNLVELIEDIRLHSDKAFDSFNASKEDTIKRYTKLIPEIKNAWDKNPLISDLGYSLNRLLELTK